MELTKKWMLNEVIRVLVVDHDSVTLKVVSKMLGVCGYQVVTANCAIGALNIAQEREEDLHLILTELHLPDMGRYELLEKMNQTSKLPIVIMSTDDDGITKLGCLFKGALLYLVKPLTIKNVRTLWQFSFIKGRERTILVEVPNRVREESIDENESENDSKRNEKKKFQKISSREAEEDEIDSTVVKKPKLIWSEELHNRFLQAIKALGIDKAHPKEILHHMNVPGLRKENISSHLQKFRLSLKRDRGISKTSILGEESVQLSNQQYGRQVPSNIGVFMAKPSFGQESQPQLSNNLPSSSINSNLFGSHDEVSFESLNNGNMNRSCYAKAISNDFIQQRSLDQMKCQNLFECKREEMIMSTIHQPPQMEDRHCMFKVDAGQLDGIFDMVKDYTINLHDI
ncbi:two-component response regulator ORR26-like [Momordica charantia]|uniref:Two-component response regulator ORR26-like n=1 Tax=Momordica charantia TaxID=3673 RepID=A0A6J1DPR1_MOMCH|nr:two-component response regulator ORR26-like [Momordica charantia]